jgi:hypothetical protein
MRSLIFILVLGVSLSFNGDDQKKKNSSEATKLLAETTLTPTPQNKKYLFEFNQSKGSHSVKLFIKTKPFNPKEHKIEKIRDEKNDFTYQLIDGKNPFGVELSTPRIEIEFVKLVFDGKETTVEKDLFSDCYNPNLEEDYFWLKISNDGESLMTFMAGSDAGGGYQLFWIFRKDGKHSRFAQASPDGDYLGFARTFFNEQ